MVDCVCVICGKTFLSKRNKKYCSDDCYRKDIWGGWIANSKKANAYLDRNRGEVNSKRRERRVHVMHEKTCIHCGAAFTSKRSDKVSCGKRDSLHREGEKVRRIDVTCEHCGKVFKRRVGDYNRDVRNGKPQGCCNLHTQILKGNTLVLTCSECGKVFHRSRSQYEQDNRVGGYVFCSKECWKANTDYRPRGSAHGRYIDGKSAGYRGRGWTAIRRRIRERDNNTCYLCGITNDVLGKELDVHHLTRFGDFEDEDEANSGENLISLCPSCHHSEEVHKTISRIVPLIRERKAQIAACLCYQFREANVFGTVRN